jgi:hypothetical protein
MKTIEERKSILDKEIFKHVNHGWRITTRSDTKAILVKEKKTNGCLLIFLIILFVVPGIIYLLVNKGKGILKIEVTQEGDVKCQTIGLSTFEIHELESY